MNLKTLLFQMLFNLEIIKFLCYRSIPDNRDWIRDVIICSTPSRVSTPVAWDSKSSWWATICNITNNIFFAHGVSPQFQPQQIIAGLKHYHTWEWISLSRRDMPSASLESCSDIAFPCIAWLAWALTSKVSSKNFLNSSVKNIDYLL